MKKYALIITTALTALSVSAQETYENARLMETDLNGTARYVAMGGAMDALGADISTISTNPAGIGLFRHSTVSTSFGLVSQEDAHSFRTGSKTNASFDQIGFVWSNRTNKTSFFNFAFNFHKSQNFDYILSAAGKLDGNSSQNGLSHIKAIGEREMVDGKKEGASMYNFDAKDKCGTPYWTSMLDNLYYNAFIITDVDRQTNSCIVGWNPASDFLMNRANTGYIGEYDINLSGSINNRVYLGLTVGIHDVHYKGVSEYTENLLDNSGPAGKVTVSDERNITGTGFDVKAGVIFRPVESSPFRIGLSIASPTLYKLKTQNTTRLLNTTAYTGINPSYVAKGSYDFKLNTPWKFGLSLGHTIDQMVALGAGIEYADYGSIDTREITDEYYDSYYDSYTTESVSDHEMNHHTQETLKGVLQLKLGAEVKIDKNFAVRFGYNYASPMYKEDGTKDFTLDSYGTNCSSATDFTNWKDTNRFTCGFGYRYNNFNIDLAYQYSVRNGKFYPFQNGWGDYYYYDDNDKIACEQIDIISTPVNVTNKRHQLLLTLGYTF